ncbi:hypothetical protein J6590_101727, partial [Homalodisca vitripennis]
DLPLLFRIHQFSRQYEIIKCRSDWWRRQRGVDLADLDLGRGQGLLVRSVPQQHHLQLLQHPGLRGSVLVASNVWVSSQVTIRDKEAFSSNRVLQDV